MFGDEETEVQHKRLPGEEAPAAQAASAAAAAAASVAPAESAVPEYLEGVRQVRPPDRPLLRPGTMKPQSQPRPLQISNGTRRLPSYPAWEKPPSPFEYPRLRGQEVHRPLKPLLIATVGVALIAGVILLLNNFVSHGGVAVASGSAGPTASVSGSASHGPNGSGSQGPSPSASATVNQGTPGPQISFQLYQVLAGDSATRIAIKFHLKTWEFLAANPKLKAPNYSVVVGTWVNIPLPGQMTPPTPTPEPTPGPTPTPTPASP